MNCPLEEILELRNANIFVESANDYRQYRVKITNRIAKCRKRLKIEQRTLKGSKEMKRKSISVDDITRDIEFARVLLYLAERSWAHAMEAKAILETKDSLSKKKHAISKLAKATKYIGQLTCHLDDCPFSEVAKLELYTYQAVLMGTLAMERHNWHSALSEFSSAKIGLQVLYGREISESSKELIRDLISTGVDVSLSFAAYQSKHDRKVDLPTLAKQIVSKNDSSKMTALINNLDRSALNMSKEESGSHLDSIRWRAHNAQVQDPDLASLILEAQKLDSGFETTIQIGGTAINAFDNLLQTWQDAADFVKEAIDRVESSQGGATRHDQQKQDLYIVSTYINYTLLLRRIQRDCMLIDQLAARNTKKSTSKELEKNRDIVRIYDTILQSCSQLLELPGVHNDEDLFDSLTTLSQFFRLRRTCLLGLSYRIQGDYKSSLALYALAQKNITEQSSSSSLPLGSAHFKVQLAGSSVSNQDFDNALSELSQQLSRAHGMAAFVELSEKNVINKNGPSVAESLSRYPQGTPQEILDSLVNPWPKIRPVPLKPVFYDIAYNFLNLDETVESEESESNHSKDDSNVATTDLEQKKGFFGSLWGRK